MGEQEKIMDIFGSSEGVSNCAPTRAVRLVQCRLLGRDSFLKVLRCGRYSVKDMKFSAFSQQFSNDQTLNKYVMEITLRQKPELDYITNPRDL